MLHLFKLFLIFMCAIYHCPDHYCSEKREPELRCCECVLCALQCVSDLNIYFSLRPASLFILKKGRN
jgi:hypothetical protein